MIKANCRQRFTADDFDFVVKVLSTSAREEVSLVELLTDAEARDAILDDPRLVRTVLEAGAPLRISPQLYFYVLTRHVLKKAGLPDRAVTDYVASLLEQFSQTARMRSPADGSARPVQYVSDMLLALRDASPRESFLIRSHVGNYALFMTGIFHESVQSRATHRGAPDLSFYEDVGRSSYRAVAQHAVARACDLSGVYEMLADTFHEIRLALNRLADSLLHLDAAHLPAGALL